MDKKKYIIEVCVDSLESAKNAIKAGAHRLEVCSALSLGGLTPSPGLVQEIRSFSDIPVHVLIRPRSGDFTYNYDEYKTILKDIQIYSELDIQGIVCGILNENAEPDLIRTAKLIEISRPVSFTFHRAFDYIKDKKEAVMQLIKLGADRILTSGGSNSAIEGFDVLKALINKAENKLSIMPGGGVDAKNIQELLLTGAKEFHMSGKSVRKGVNYQTDLKTGAKESDFEEIFVSDELKIANTIKKITYE